MFKYIAEFWSLVLITAIMAVCLFMFLTAIADMLREINEASAALHSSIGLIE